MKNLILIFLFLITSCKQAESKPVIIEKEIDVVRTDTVFIPKVDTVYVAKPSVAITQLQKSNDSLKVANNKLGKELLHNKLIIQNAKYYLNIANKNPSQQKFLRGWMNRALNQ